MSRFEFGKNVPTWDGVPMIGGFPMGLTKTFFVDYGNGSDSYSAKSNGVNRPWKTIAKAEGAITTNKNEGIALMGNATHALTEMLSFAKNRAHLFGYDPGGRMYGQNAKIAIGVTTAATDIAAMKNTGIRNSFTNIKFISDNTVAEGLYTVAEGGEYASYQACEIYKSEDLDDAGAAELLHNGDSAQFYKCTIGSSANETGNIRANVLLTATLSGKKCRDSYFESCILFGKADDTDKVFVYGANATDVERMLMFNGCTFMNNPLSAGTPAHAVGFGAAQTEGAVILKDCTSVDCTVMAQAAVGIYVDGAVPTFATSGVSVTA